MQTFFPHPSISKSVELLDNARLNKQRIEAMQILNALGMNPNDHDCVRALQQTARDPTLIMQQRLRQCSAADPAKRTGWTNHPAVVMWREHPATLAEYGLEVEFECRDRGLEPSIACHDHFRTILAALSKWKQRSKRPWWAGSSVFHVSHQLNLIYKDPVHYEPLFPLPESERINMRRLAMNKPRYVWPVNWNIWEVIKHSKSEMSIRIGIPSQSNKKIYKISTTDPEHPNYKPPRFTRAGKHILLPFKLKSGTEAAYLLESQRPMEVDDRFDNPKILQYPLVSPAMSDVFVDLFEFFTDTQQITDPRTPPIPKSAIHKGPKESHGVKPPKKLSTSQPRKWQ